MKPIVIRYILLVMLTLLAINFMLNPVLEKYGIRLIRNQLDQYHQSLLKGPYFVIMKYYETVPEDQIPEQTRALQKEFGFPITSVEITSNEFTPSERKVLEKGEMLIRDEWENYYERIRQTKWAIKLGPLKDLDDIFNLWHFNLVIWVSIAFLASLFSVIAAVPFWRSLKSLMGAASRFGEGDFNARARVSKRSTLYPMARTFNGMADRIGGLIRSQKFLINAVSHELRTPIARIRFGMEMLENADDRSGVNRYAAGISEDIDELDSLVSELLAYTAFDGKMAFLKLRPIKTEIWLGRLVSKLAPLAGEKKIRLDLSRAPDTFEGDPKFLSRAMENLVLNGLRHTRTQVVICVKSHKDRLSIRVTDDGPGIPEEERDRIFEPFIRLDKSRNRDSGGFGLGLAIVRQVIESHGGQVTVEENKGPGACFAVILPLEGLKPLRKP